MKKITLLSSLFCFFVFNGFCAPIPQTFKSLHADGDLHRVEFGFRFMPTFSNFDMATSTGGTVKSEVTLGYGIGGILAFNFSNHVGIQGELMYNSLSQKYKDQDLDRKINVRYFNIPLMLSLNTDKTAPVNLNVVFGPQLGVNMGSNISSSSGNGSDTLQTVIALKKSDFGIAYGAGLEFALNEIHTIRFDLGFRGVYGLMNISKSSSQNSDSYSVKKANVRTESLYLGLSFLF